MVRKLAALLLLAPVLAAAPAPSRASESLAPLPAPLEPVVINGVRYEALEYPSKPLAWRNLAITVLDARVQQWQALSRADRATQAQAMIDRYRSGTKFAGFIELSFIDEHGATLDRFVWDPRDTPLLRK